MPECPVVCRALDLLSFVLILLRWACCAVQSQAVTSCLGFLNAGTVDPRHHTRSPTLSRIYSVVPGRHCLKACWVLCHVPQSSPSLPLLWTLSPGLFIQSLFLCTPPPFPFLTRCPQVFTFLFVPSLPTQSPWSPFLPIPPSRAIVQASIKWDGLGLSGA